jgi:hypothetical protein
MWHHQIQKHDVRCFTANKVEGLARIVGADEISISFQVQ